MNTDDANNQLQAELDAHNASLELEPANGADYSISHWVLKSTKTLPKITWAPMDKFPSRQVMQTRRTYGHGYVRYDEAMILRPQRVTTQQLESTRRRLA